MRVLCYSMSLWNWVFLVPGESEGHSTPKMKKETEHMAPAGSVVESYLSFVKPWVYFQQWKGKEEIEKCLRNEVINLLADVVYQDIFLSPTSLSLWITEWILLSFGKLMTWQGPQMTKWSASTYFQNSNLKVKIKAPWACHTSLNSQMYWVTFKNVEQSSERWDTSGPYRSLSQWPEFHRTLGCSPVPAEFYFFLAECAVHEGFQV